jgi:hypothetical protein
MIGKTSCLPDLFTDNLDFVVQHSSTLLKARIIMEPVHEIANLFVNILYM